VTIEAIASRIVEWAAPLQLGYVMDNTGDIALLFTPGGETRWYLRTNSGEFFVGSAQRSAEEFFEIATTTEDDAERYLLNAIGPSLRAELLPQAPRVAPQVRLDEMTESFTLTAAGDGTPHGILRENGQYRARFSSYTTAMYAVRFSQYANAPLEDIRASYADQFGKPVFSVDVTQMSA
jgi:hypothetical protein